MARQKMRNHFFHIFYPGLQPGSDLSDSERRELTSVAVTDNGEFVSICTPDGCAVFYSSEDLRELADVLQEAADQFDECKAHPKEHQHG